MKQELLELLLSQASVSGEEFALQDRLETYVKERIKGAECVRDRIGDGIYTVCAGKSGKKILLSAHIDEIGLAVTTATSDGFLKVTNVGGVTALTYPGHSVAIHTDNGIVYGSVAADGDAMKKEGFSAKDLRIDIGAATKEEALSLVSPGDTVVQDTSVRELANGRVSARGLDDKTGVYVMIEALRRAAEETVNDLYAAATAGEETSKHGARWAAERIQPDEALIVDVTFTSDYDGMRDAEWGEISLGGGPAICINPICDKEMTRRLREIAEEKQIPYQIEVSAGKSCTDADEIHFAGLGIPVALVSVPLRYMHSPAEVADTKDLEWCIQLLAEYMKR